jgi:hypothetical protein
MAAQDQSDSGLVPSPEIRDMDAGLVSIIPHCPANLPSAAPSDDFQALRSEDHIRMLP